MAKREVEYSAEVHDIFTHGSVPQIAKILAERDTLKAQRDALLLALKNLVARLENADGITAPPFLIMDLKPAHRAIQQVEQPPTGGEG